MCVMHRVVKLYTDIFPRGGGGAKALLWRGGLCSLTINTCGRVSMLAQHKCITPLAVLKGGGGGGGTGHFPPEFMKFIYFKT